MPRTKPIGPPPIEVFRSLPRTGKGGSRLYWAARACGMSQAQFKRIFDQTEATLEGMVYDPAFREQKMREIESDERADTLNQMELEEDGLHVKPAGNGALGKVVPEPSPPASLSLRQVADMLETCVAALRELLGVSMGMTVLVALSQIAEAAHYIPFQNVFE